MVSGLLAHDVQFVNEDCLEETIKASWVLVHVGGHLLQ